MDLTRGKADIIAAVYEKLCALQRMSFIPEQTARALHAFGVPVALYTIREDGHKKLRRAEVPLACSMILHANIQKVATPVAMVAKMLRLLSAEEIDSMCMLLEPDDFVDTIAKRYKSG